MNGPQTTPTSPLFYIEWLAKQDNEHWAADVIKDEDFMVPACERRAPQQSPEQDAIDAAIARFLPTVHHIDLYEQALNAAPVGTVTKSMLDDLEYFKNKLSVSLAIPKEYFEKAQ